MKHDCLSDFADIRGRKRRVIHAPGALDSWAKASRKLAPARVNLIEGFLIGLYSDWIDGNRLHSGWARAEGNLGRTSKFYAIRRIPLRAYFFYSRTGKDTIVISHYVVKKWKKLRKKDISRVKTNWENERNGNGK